jgi:hypothetical protein
LILDAYIASVIHIYIEAFIWLDSKLLIFTSLLLANLDASVLFCIIQRRFADAQIVFAYLISLRAYVRHPSVLGLDRSILLRTLILTFGARFSPSLKKCLV